MSGPGTSPKSQGGFTLLEILVVLVIAGLMLTLVPPLFGGAVSGVRLKGAARELTVVLRETRSQAIIRNAELTIDLDLESPAYRVGGMSPQSLPAGVALSVRPVTGAADPGSNRHVLHFFPDGSSSGGQITVSGGTQAYHIKVDWLTGSIRVVEAAS